jgi:adenosylcobinamide-phosphate synthase
VIASSLDPGALLAALVLALIIELTVGEPPVAVHPVVWMGRAARAVLRLAPARPLAQLGFGALLALGLPLLCAALAGAALAALAPWPIVQVAVAAPLSKASFAVRALGDAGRAVAEALAAGRLGDARHALRSLCSRDAAALAPAEVAAGAVESVAENASDSIVAPLVYFVAFGVPGALAYRAINTLDALIGYRGRYEHLGKAAARLDDLANLVPARLTALLLVGAAALRGQPVARGVATWWRDARRTASPNAGHPMAAMAGLLGVALAKPGAYRLGDDIGGPPDAATIAAAWRVVRLAAALAFALAAAALAAGSLHGR